jgi:hypothetical protein
MTNFEKIKNMRTDTFAEFLFLISAHCFDKNCDGCPLSDTSFCEIDGIAAWLDKEIDE